jgi:hypothetical protein
MNKAASTCLLICLLWLNAQARFYREPVFGLDIPIYHWGWQADRVLMRMPLADRIGEPSDAANLRIASGNDTTDIILLIDHLTWRVHWLRAEAGISPRRLQHFGTYGEDGSGSGQFAGVCRVAVARTGPLYDPATDHIFLADRLNHRIVKMNFTFDPSSPENDKLIWESSCFVDSEFLPADLAYLNIHPQNRQNNKLLALDDGGQRLVVFSDNGNMIAQINLRDPLDSIPRTYHSFAYKLNNDQSLSLYLVDGANGSIRLFRLTSNGQLQYVNELNMGNGLEISLTDISYFPALGLWVVESQGPRIYHIADDLSGIIQEINGDDFNPRILFRPYRIRVFPDRLVIFEETGEQTGIITVAFDLPRGKENPPVNNSNLPTQFALHQNYPNPFNSNTIISFDLASSGPVELIIYNILGQQVITLANQSMPAGSHSLVWSGRNSDGHTVSSGIYFARLKTDDKTAVKKLILLK